MSSNSISIVNLATPRTLETRAPGRSPAAGETQAEKTSATGNGLPTSREAGAADEQRLADAISELNGFVQNIQRNLEFTVDDESGRTVIKVIDSESKEIIRQIPPEEVVQLARVLEYAKDGTILNARA